LGFQSKTRISLISTDWKFVQIRGIRVKVFTMARRKLVKSAALATTALPNELGGGVPTVKPVRRGKGK
jgi:hypothetical protein